MLEPHDNFEVRIDAVDPKWSGSLKLGLTTFNITGKSGLGSMVTARLSNTVYSIGSKFCVVFSIEYNSYAVWRLLTA